MAKEHERKFLVSGEQWRDLVKDSSEIVQGYIVCDDNAEARVRVINNSQGLITFKSNELGVTRSEFEFDIESYKGTEILDAFGNGRIIKKTRHELTSTDGCWTIDEFKGRHSGIVVLEIETGTAPDCFDIPEWATSEVTADTRYRNRWLSMASNDAITSLRGIKFKDKSSRKYEVTWSGSLKRKDVSFKHIGEQKLTPLEQEIVSINWDKRKIETEASGQLIFDSNIFGLVNFQEDVESGLNIIINTTNYSSYVASRSPASCMKRANPIGTSVVPLTIDGFIPIGKRSPQADVNPNKYFTFGGFFDAKKDYYGGSPCVFRCIQREVEEELGISVDVNDLKLISIVNDLVSIHPEFCFLVSTKFEKTDFEKATWAEELSTIEFISVSDLSNFLGANQENFTPTLFGALLMLSQSLSSEVS